MRTYHGIIAEFIHEVRRLVAFIVVEPHGALELIPGVQQEQVLLVASDLLDFGEASRDAGVTVSFRALPRVLVGLLDAGVDVVGVQNGQLPVRRRAQQQQQQRQQRQQRRVEHSVACDDSGSARTRSNA